MNIIVIQFFVKKSEKNPNNNYYPSDLICDTANVNDYKLYPAKVG